MQYLDEYSVTGDEANSPFIHEETQHLRQLPPSVENRLRLTTAGLELCFEASILDSGPESALAGLVDYFNQTMAKPFKGAYRGEPPAALKVTLLSQTDLGILIVEHCPFEVAFLSGGHPNLHAVSNHFQIFFAEFAKQILIAPFHFLK